MYLLEYRTAIGYDTNELKLFYSLNEMNIWINEMCCKGFYFKVIKKYKIEKEID